MHPRTWFARSFVAPLCLPAALAATLAACKNDSPTPAPGAAASSASAATAAAPPKVAHDAIPRATFNQLALRNNLPLYWASDDDGDGAVDPDEVRSLLFYPSDTKWTAGGAFTPAFDDVYAQLVKVAKAPPPEDARARLVLEDLAQGAPTLVYSDLRAASPGDKEMFLHIVAASKLIDRLYAVENGLPVLAAAVPAGDAASQSLFRRNWGPKCVGPKTEKDPACSAIPGAATRPTVDVYPADLQSDAKFCEALEKRTDAKALLEPFTVVRRSTTDAKKLTAVPLTVAYKDTMTEVATELRAAAAAIVDPSEAPMRAYLTAAAQSFTDNDWLPSDEAWSKMNAQNSKYYLRVGADETYWEPCNHKAGFHMTFARINAESLKWQSKLTPVQQEMEKTLAAAIGAPYAERKVTFHLPDFIDIVFNSGDDRNPIGATIGQSLPNWGKVAAEGRGRTVAMSNLYTDKDSMHSRQEQAESLLTKETMVAYSADHAAGMLKTILHEATHNLGPAHEYAYKGKTDAQWFGGGLASMMEELKSETGALYFIDFIQKKGIIDEKTARQTHVDGIVWAFGHISRGMYESGGQRKGYSQLAAIQIGFLMDEGALKFGANAPAANGKDKGAFTLDFAKMPAAVDKMMKVVGRLKATGDRAGAEALAKKYVDSDAIVPHKIITERVLRFPKASFVYALDM